jgi:hypothetical protein
MHEDTCHYVSFLHRGSSSCFVIEVSGYGNFYQNLYFETDLSNFGTYALERPGLERSKKGLILLILDPFRSLNR